MSSRRFSSRSLPLLAVLVAAVCGLLASSAAARPAVSGTAPLVLRDARDVRRAPQRIEHITIALALRNRAGLARLLRTAHHRNLTPAQFAGRYGPSRATVSSVTRWARRSHLRVAGVSRNRTLVSLTARTGSLARALRTHIDVFRAANGSTYRSVSRRAVLPAAFSRRVVGVTGLSSLGRVRRAGLARIRRQAGSTVGPRTFGPKELSAFYDAPASATGSSQSVGVIAEGNLAQVQTDLRTFESKYGVPQVPVTVTGPGSSDTAGQDEYDLDTQYASSQAPDAANLEIYDGKSLSNDDILSIINTWATQGTVKTASFSAGECEILAGLTGFTTSLDQVLAQAAAQGQTLFVSSGDNGSFCGAVVGANGVPAGVPSVEYPASSPYAVGVGGTTVTGTPPIGSAYTGEIAWIAGGGGISYFEGKPSYQSVPNLVRRGVPDVALDADPLTGYAVVVSGQVETIGGTSASAPAWNGYWARALGARGALGFANPRLYGAGAKAGFHDVVAGSNGIFPAHPGYDYTTGLGTPDLAKLIPLL